MINITLEEVNQWGKMSCTNWNNNRISRRFYRAKYRDVAMKYWATEEHQRLVTLYKSGIWTINTYPWPYSDPEFGHWDEDDSDKGYSLISDQSNCVIKYATSYVAYKIFEETGVWPQKKTHERLDAKRWVQFLSEAGYNTIVDKPEKGNRYVGVNPNKGEWGSVVWFETYIQEISGHSKEPKIVVSTYSHKQHRWLYVDPNKYTWVKIS